MSQEIRKRDIIWGLCVSALGGFKLGVYITKSVNKKQYDAARIESADFVELDKQVAISQIGDQVADNTSDQIRTQGFANLAKKYPWLNEIKKTVGLFAIDDRFSAYGSSVLLDQQGTIVLCAHELPDHPAKLLFYLGRDSVVQARANDFRYDKNHDVMFATIDPSLIKKFGLLPVQWGRMGSSGEEAGQDIISVGWPSPSIRLHAVKGKVASFKDKVVSKDGIQAACKMESDNVTFPGMSGGAVFHDKKFVGIINAGVGPGIYPRSYFTPVDFIMAAYVDLYPDRARKSGVNMPKQLPNLPAVPDSCRYDRRGFLSALLPKI